MEWDQTLHRLTDFETITSPSELVTIIPKMDLDFGNVVELRLLFFNILKNNIQHVILDLKNVQSIDEITFDVLMEIAKKMDLLFTAWQFTFKNVAPKLIDIIQETPITYIYENVIID